MNSRLVELLRRAPLSPARRLFAMQQMLDLAEHHGQAGLGSILRHAINGELERMRQPPVYLLSDPEPTSDDDNSQFLLAIVEQILAEQSPATAQRLLAPILEQVERLVDFEGRPPVASPNSLR